MLIKQGFIVPLSFSRSLATKCILNNEPYLARPIIDFSPDEHNHTVSSPLPFLQGGLKNFQYWQKGGGTCTFRIFRGGVSKKGGADFFRGGA